MGFHKLDSCVMKRTAQAQKLFLYTIRERETEEASMRLIHSDTEEYSFSGFSAQQEDKDSNH